MVRKSKKLIVTKSFLDYKPDYPDGDFSDLNPTLYLEMLENKDKVKPELKNKPHVPVILKEEKKDKKEEKKKKEPTFINDDDLLIEARKALEMSNMKTVKSTDKPGKSKFLDIKPPSKVPKVLKNIEKEIVKKVEKVKSKGDINNKETAKKKAQKLRDIINGKEEKSSEHRKSDKSSDYRKSDKSSSSEHRKSDKEDKSNPPPLSDVMGDKLIDVKGKTVKVLSQYTTTTEKTEIEKKRELIYKFEILKRKYKKSKVPDVTEATNLESMERLYEGSIRTLSLDSTVETYKKYLIGGFMIFETLLGMLGLPMSGFAKQQILGINQYESLLVELGEKSYIDKNSSWPVELRLGFIVLINTAFFLASKKLMGKGGGDIMNAMNKTSEPSSNTKKMKGPVLDEDETTETGNVTTSKKKD